MFLAYLLTNFVFVHILLTASKNSNWFTSYSLKDDNWLMIRLGSQLGWYPIIVLVIFKLCCLKEKIKIDDNNIDYLTRTLRNSFFSTTSLLTLIPMAWFLSNRDLRNFSRRKLKEVCGVREDERWKTRDRVLNGKSRMKRFVSWSANWAL